MQAIIAVNVGSSSLKLSVHEKASLDKKANCEVENIGQEKSLSEFVTKNKKLSKRKRLNNHLDALEQTLNWLYSEFNYLNVCAVGHRIVFNGVFGADVQEITKEYLINYKSLSEIDPDHAPYVFEVIKELKKRFPAIPHVACSDSYFFKGLPKKVQVLPIPRKYYENGIKKYGFHGLSYTYLLNQIQNHAPRLADKKLIFAHLGSGASLAAVANGKPVDTTMSFSPTSGIVMSSRSGDLDPSVVTYLMKQEGLTPEQFNDIANHESGIKGISGTTADMRELLNQEDENTNAREAIEVFCYQITKYIGALTSAMNGVDALIFTGGIGERSARIRWLICSSLQYLDIELDKQKNEAKEAIISKQTSKPVIVMKTDEEIIIARETREFC
jgi:acetate kinase